MENFFLISGAACLLPCHCCLVFKLFHYFYNALGTFVQNLKLNEKFVLINMSAVGCHVGNQLQAAKELKFMLLHKAAVMDFTELNFPSIFFYVF